MTPAHWYDTNDNPYATRARRNLPTCQGCGQRIDIGEKVVCVIIGTLELTAHPHAKVTQQLSKDWFHRSCEVAVRDLPARTDDVPICQEHDVPATDEHEQHEHDYRGRSTASSDVEEND